MLDPILDVPNKTTSDTSFDAILDKKIPDPDPCRSAQDPVHLRGQYRELSETLPLVSHHLLGIAASHYIQQQQGPVDQGFRGNLEAFFLDTKSASESV
jgi:hypothetical protein